MANYRYTLVDSLGNRYNENSATPPDQSGLNYLSVVNLDTGQTSPGPLASQPQSAPAAAPSSPAPAPTSTGPSASGSYQHIITSNGQQYTVTNNLPPAAFQQIIAQQPGMQYVSGAPVGQAASTPPPPSSTPNAGSAPPPGTPPPTNNSYTSAPGSPVTNARTNPVTFKMPDGSTQVLNLKLSDVTGSASPQLQQVLSAGGQPIYNGVPLTGIQNAWEGGALYTDPNNGSGYLPLNVVAGFGYLPGQQQQLNLLQSSGWNPTTQGALPTSIQWPSQGAGSLTLTKPASADGSSPADTQAVDASNYTQIDDLLHKGYQALNSQGNPYVTIDDPLSPGAQMFLNPDTGDVSPLNVVLGGPWTQQQLQALPQFMQTGAFRTALTTATKANPNIPISALSQAAIAQGSNNPSTVAGGDIASMLQSGSLIQPFTQQFNFPTLDLGQVATPFTQQFTPNAPMPTAPTGGAPVPTYSNPSGPLPNAPTLVSVPSLNVQSPQIPNYTPSSNQQLPGAFTLPTGQDALNQDPGYQFVLSQGLKGINAQNSALGNDPMGAATLKDIANYTTGLASTEYGSAVQRALQAFQANMGRSQAATGQDIANYQAGLQGQQQQFAQPLSLYQTSLGAQGQQTQEQLAAFNAALAAQGQGFQQGLSGYQAQLAGQQQQFAQPLSLYQTALGAQGQQYGQSLQDYLNQYQIQLGNETNLANQYQTQYGNAMQEYLNQFNINNANQTNAFNRLASISGMGQVAGSQLANVGLNYGGQYANTSLSGVAQGNNLLGTAASAQGAGNVGSANAWSRFLGNTGNNLLNVYNNSQYGGSFA